MRSTVDGSFAVAVTGRTVSVSSASSPISVPRPTTTLSPPSACRAVRLNAPSCTTKPESAGSPALNSTSPECT